VFGALKILVYGIFSIQGWLVFNLKQGKIQYNLVETSKEINIISLK